MSLKFRLFFCFCLINQAVCLSQNKLASLYKRCSVKTINYEQGLLNNGTTNVITDALGFTWVSTKTGMQRYNGYTLETIKPVLKKEIVNVNSPVYFFELHNGLIWISYKSGVLEYDIHKNLFTKLISLESSTDLSFSFIPLKETSEGIWGIQDKKGLVLYSPQGELIKNIPTNEAAFEQNTFHRPEVFSNITFTVNRNYAFIYNGTDRIEQFNFGTHEINYIQAENIFSFCCSDTHLYIISNSDIKSINIANTTFERNILLKTITGESVNRSACFLSDEGHLLISLNTHLYEFDTLCNYQKEYTNFNLNPVGDVGFIRAIYADNFKRIWLLCNDNIKRIQNFNIPFEHLIYTNEKNNFVRSLYYDEKKHFLLAGCYNGGIQLFDTLGNPLWQSTIASDSVKDINAIEKLNNDNYFIETIGRGLYVLNLPSKKVSRLQLDNPGIATPDYANIYFINNLQRINDSSIFIATYSNVFNCIFKNEKLKSATRLIPSDNVPVQQVDCFIYSRNKTLWAGTASGNIYKVDASKKLQLIHIPESYQIRSFAEDAQENIWVGTDKGLYVYKSSGAFLKKFTNESGLLNDCIYALLAVKNKSAVFASSNVGLSFVSLDENIINYTKESGLQENEFNTESAIKSNDGKFYFGGINGITAFYPAALSDIMDHPVLDITRLSIDDSLYNFSTENWRNDSIILHHNQNHIELDFGALGLLNTNEYKYQYRLQNFDKNWQTTHQPTGIKYVLEPGNYTFEISCSPVFSTNSIFKKSFIIIISPAWWQTIWFKILLLIVSIAIIAFIVQQYIRQRYLKKIRTLELQQQIQKERERISRDLHDNLGAYAAAIASNVSSIKNSDNEANEPILNQLKNNSQSIINQLNDTIWALNKEAISLTIISDRFKVFLQKIQPNYPNVHIEIKEEITQDTALSPSNALHLFRIMQEAINNSLRHSNCANILLKIISNDIWSIIIKDDGKGMQINGNGTSGNGLQNIKLRGEEAGWKVIWNPGIPKGTELIISSANIN